mgnify:CR=1 FL=1
MVESMTIQEFLDVLSSKEPVPGGGGASALAGALGNALGQMVANLTIGKKKYALVEDEIKELAERMKGIQGQFSALADQDAKVFAPLAKCYSLPSGTEEEKAYKAEVMEARLLDASLCQWKSWKRHRKCWKSWISLRIGKQDGCQRRGRGSPVHPDRTAGRGDECVHQYQVHEEQGEGRRNE